MATAPRGNAGGPGFGPSGHLLAMFRACSSDPTEAVKTKLRRLLHIFLQHHQGNEGTKELAAKCCCEAGAWYYSILESICIEEKERLGLSDISQGILKNELFQRCLVPCCLEITRTSNRLPCDFPLLLQIFKVAPYHFCKVIEAVLRVGAGLPRSGFAHLAQVEHNILESWAWTSDSPLWEDIRANEGRLPTCQQAMPPTQLEDPTGAAAQPDRHLPRDQQRSGSSSLHLFARKVYGLMGKRLRELCSALGVRDELRLKIWTCFEHSLVHRTGLMAGRHLDQLLMCAIYVIAKITKPEIPFKHIMKCYKSQLQTCNSVCKKVLISERVLANPPVEGNGNGGQSSATLTPNTPSTHNLGPGVEERDNLIFFYNRIYTTKMAHFTMQFSLTAGGDTPLSPYPRQWTASPRRQRLCGSDSVFISPLNTTSTHQSGLVYVFSSSSSERLREINNMIRTGRSPNRRSYAASRGTENEEEGEDGPPARRLRLDDQSAWQRRLRSVVDDRIMSRNTVSGRPRQVNGPNLTCSPEERDVSL
ncbi:retinoblastoma-like protein 2 isoform X1 [Brachyistius frenatus]|uniref:retinoblastoma-like protein 2 isoform X1 n=1 Tax=Brachyistius frenatus TaxID=100188 RepID=UPI0037E9B042